MIMNRPDTIQPVRIPAPLSYEELRDIIDLALWAGQLLLEHGAETQRVEDTVYYLGTGLGCERLNILVSPNAMVITTISGDEFRTKIRRVRRIGINMTIVAAVTRLSHQIATGTFDRVQVRTELDRISRLRPSYNRWFVVAVVGLACAAFSRLFGADWPAFGITFLAAAVAQFVRQELTRRDFNAVLIVVITAMIAGLIAGSATKFNLGETPEVTLVASVLLLVPGVHLINSVEDLIKGHLVTGLARGMLGILVLLGIALGLIMAMAVLHIPGL